MSTQPTSKRLMSLDALRGFDMFFIMGGAALITALCDLFPEGSDSWLAFQMKHAEWDGFYHHDTIFPLFLFIAGISFPFSYAKSQSLGVSKGAQYGKILKRVLILIVLGLVCNGLFKWDFAHLRYPSVLGRIGLAWGIAALIRMNTGTLTRAILCVFLLVGYWLLIRFVPAPDAAGTGVYSMDGCIVGWVDRQIMPGHIYRPSYDPEGLLGTIPAVVTALLGMFTGDFIRLDERKQLFGKPLTGGAKTVLMLLASALMLGLGLLWSLYFPINKALWSSTFVLVAGAYSLSMFALFYWIIDVKGWRKWAHCFEIIGLNSITIYLFQRFVSVKYTNEYFLKGLAGQLSPEWGAVLLAVGYIAFCWLFLTFLYRKKIFLKV